MAYVQMVSRTSTSITVTISGLTYAPSAYAAFAWYLDGVWKAQTASGVNDYTFVGLSPDTYYDLDAQAHYGGSWQNTIDSAYESTLTNVPMEPQYWDEYDTSIENSINVSWTAIEGATSTAFILKPFGINSIVASGSTAGTSIEIPSLEYAKGYDWTFWGENSYGSGPLGTGTYFSRPKAPIISIDSTTSNQINVYVNMTAPMTLPNADFITTVYITGSDSYSNEYNIGQDGIVNCGALVPGVYYEIVAMSRFTKPPGYGMYRYSNTSNTVSHTILAAPNTPTGLVVSSDYDNAVFADWSNTANATYYTVEIYRSYDSYRVTQDVTTLSQYNFTGLESGVLYKVRISAGNGGGDSAYTAYVYGITKPNDPVISSPSATATSVSATVTLSGGYTDASVSLYKAGSLQTAKTITASGVVSFTGLLTGTQYEIRSQARIYSNPYENFSHVSNSVFITTLAPPAVPSGITITSTTTTSIGYDWPDVATATSYIAEIYKNSDSSLVEWTSFIPSNYTRNSLLPGTVYKAHFAASNAAGDSAFSSYIFTITKPNAPVLSSPIDTTTSVGCWVALSGSFADASVTLYQGTTLIDTKTITSSQTVNFTGLTTGLTYKIESQARAYSNPYQSYSVVSNALMIMAGGSRPANWTAFTMTTGTPMPKYNNKPAPVTATSWNAFTVRINEFRVYKSLANYSFTSAVQGQNATAAQVNQARTAILAMSPPTALPSAVTTGSQITATFLKGLQNSLNSIL